VRGAGALGLAAGEIVAPADGGARAEAEGEPLGEDVARAGTDGALVGVPAADAVGAAAAAAAAAALAVAAALAPAD